MNQHPTIQTTKDGTSPSSPKARGRGRPRKTVEPKTQIEVKADSSFPPPPQKQNRPSEVLATYTDEDAQLDRELELMAIQEPPISDSNSQLEKDVEVLTEEFDTLRDHIESLEKEYKPASTIQELNEQIFVAKQVGAEAIEASKEIILHYCGRKMPAVGYFIYDNIRVYVEGRAGEMETEKAFTIEQKLFGSAKK